MKKIGMIFPGQGSQYLGMCKELYDKHRVIQEYFEEASNCLEQNFVRLCFASSEKELKETVNAQTAIFLTSVSVFMLLKSKFDIVPSIVAGHSSGEYSAIFAAGGMSFADALYLLKKRALFMEEATATYKGGMVAVLGLPYEKLRELCLAYDNGDGTSSVVEIVNYNSPTQLVISGTLDALERVAGDVRAEGGKVIPLNVDGAFHSRLMTESSDKFSMYMVKVDFKDLSVPLVNNINAEVVTDNEAIKESLAKQMSSPVAWWPGMKHFEDCDIILEMGPGDKLSKMLKREWPEKEIMSINSEADIETLLAFLGKEVVKTEHVESCGQECVSEECALDDIVLVTEQVAEEPQVEGEVLVSEEKNNEEHELASEEQSE